MDDLAEPYVPAFVNHRLLSKQEEHDLGVRAQGGDCAAKNLLAEHNTRLVISTARQYQGSGLEFAALIEAGTKGLFYAVNAFNPERGRFSTLATLSITQAIRRAVPERGAPRRLPIHKWARDHYRHTINGEVGYRRQERPDEVLVNDEIRRALLQAWHKLDRLEKIVIDLRYGIMQRETYGCPKIATFLSIGRSRVAGIEERALQRMKRFMRTHH